MECPNVVASFVGTTTASKVTMIDTSVWPKRATKENPIQISLKVLTWLVCTGDIGN